MGEYGGIRKENQQETDNHMMTNTSWKDPCMSKVAQGILYRAIKLTQVVDRTQAFCNERPFGISLRARRVRKFLEAGGQHFMTITL